MNYTNGDKYDGDWINDEKDGYGTTALILGKLNYANGDKYEGEWKHDKKDGQGNYSFNA